MISRLLLCLACAANMALPAEAMTEPHSPVHASTHEGYQLRFALAGADSSVLKVAVHHPDGTTVNDAQVVIALIDGQGRHHQARAATSDDGYRIDTRALGGALNRVEAEIITGGHLLTDHFQINATA